MNINKSLTAALVAGFALTACGGGAGGGNTGTTPPSVGNPAKVASNVLQLAVGSANLNGTPGLNVVTTYRQPLGAYHPGDSGTLINSPTLTVPGALPGTAGNPVSFDQTSTIAGSGGSAATGGGPSSTEVGGHVMTSTSQNVGSANQTTFGQSGGVFSIGLEPFNALGTYDCPAPCENGDGEQTTGQPFTYTPYPVPLYDAAGDPNIVTPWGGPPGFAEVGTGTAASSILGDGDYPAGSAGISLGLDVFAGITPSAGQYQLAISVPANTGTVNQSASFNGSTFPTVGIVAAPFTPDATDNGGTFAVAVPANATEAFVEVVDYGPTQVAAPYTMPAGDVNPVSCNGASAKNPIYYTIVAHSSGTYTLGDAEGPGGSPTVCTAVQNQTLTNGATPPQLVNTFDNGTGPGIPCFGPAPTYTSLAVGCTDFPITGDQFAVTTFGFDYPAYELIQNPANPTEAPNPALVGSAGTADLSVSAATCLVQAAGGGAPATGTCNSLASLTNQAGLASAHRHVGQVKVIRRK